MRNGLEIDEFGTKSYYLNDRRHRVDGPDIEWYNGDMSWWLNGELHREDGPAVEHTNGYKGWHINGQSIDCRTQEQFEKFMRLKVFW